MPGLPLEAPSVLHLIQFKRRGCHIISQEQYRSNITFWKGMIDDVYQIKCERMDTTCIVLLSFWPKKNIWIIILTIKKEIPHKNKKQEQRINKESVNKHRVSKLNYENRKHIQKLLLLGTFYGRFSFNLSLICLMIH
jgi:hypothetical protein